MNLTRKVFSLRSTPENANRQLRMHWTKRRRQREMLWWEIYEAIGLGPWPKPFGRGDGVVLRLKSPSAPKAKCRLTVVVYRKRFHDVDNLYASCKPLVDSLKKVGWLVDDSPKWCDLVVKQERQAGAKGSTVIELVYV